VYNFENVLPENWVWVPIGELVSLYSGIGFKQSEYTSEGLRLLQIANVSFGKTIWDNLVFVPEEYSNKYPHLLINKGDILIALNRPLLGDNLKITQLTENDVPSILYQRVGKFIFYNPQIKPYFFYFCQSNHFIKQLESMLSGISQPFINKPNLLSINFPLAPLNEQRRIVEKIEELFSGLDGGIKVLSEVKKQVILYRQSVLKNAFQGELTKNWRLLNRNKEINAKVLLEKIKTLQASKKGKTNESNYSHQKSLEELPVGWEWAKLEDLVINPNNDIVDGPFGSDLKASEYIEDGVPIIRIQNIERNQLNFNNIKYVHEEKAEQLKRHSLTKKDILITKLGSPLGKACMVADNIEIGIMVADIVRVRIGHEFIDKKYITYFLNSLSAIKEFEKITKGTTRPRVNLTNIRCFNIPVPPLEEQRKVVDEIEFHLSIADEVEKLVDKCLRQSRVLRRSILETAFKGKLVAQNFKDETSIRLLADINKRKEMLEMELKEKERYKSVNNKDIHNWDITNTKVQNFDIKRDIYDILLSENNPIKPKELFKLSGIEDVEEFYYLLKDYVEVGKIIQKRPNSEDVFLEAVK
jgi:type I restriction enzyme S subunit